MSSWILNRLISCCLDNAAVLETAGAVLPDRNLSAKLRELAAENAASAHELALLLFRLNGRPDFVGTGAGASRCRTLAQAAAAGRAGRMRALAACLKSMGDALVVCEGFAVSNSVPLVRSAVEIAYADFRMHRLELARLLEEVIRCPGSGEVGPEERRGFGIRLGDSAPREPHNPLGRKG